VLANPGVGVILALSTYDQSAAGVLNDDSVMGQIFLGGSGTNYMDLGGSRAGTDFNPAINAGHFDSGTAGQVVALVGFILEGPSVIALVASGGSLERMRRNREDESGGDEKPN